MHLPDNETRIDFLNYEVIAKTIAKLIDDGSGEPLTIGVHGEWGAGKSSVLLMLEDAFQERDNVLCLRVNGWRYQGFEDAKISLIEAIVNGLVEERGLLTKAKDSVASVLRRIRWMKLARGAAGVVLTATTGVPDPAIAGAIASVAKDKLTGGDGSFDAGDVDEVAEAGAGLLGDRGETSLPREIDAFRRDFEDLLAAADIERLVVLVDDLDRCLPKTVIEFLEAIRLFVLMRKTAFVVAADDAMIQYAVRQHFPDLPESSGSRAYARDYLEKLIQVPFRLPVLGEAEVLTYVSLLLLGRSMGDDEEAFSAILGKAREHLARPWTAGMLEIDPSSNATLAPHADTIREAMGLSVSIGPTLAAGADGNPRQVKRFLNALFLRKAAGDARGIGDEVGLAQLAKLMLAEYFLPDLFGLIAEQAVTDPQGRSAAIRSLEETEPDAAEQDVSEFDDDARGWGKVQPSLKEIDLRPLLFVSKDRKDYFGDVSALGQLRHVVDRLLRPQARTAAANTELKHLTPNEAQKVFDAIAQRIAQSTDYQTKPVGIDGLRNLVIAHPKLAIGLARLLSSLPADRLGAWAASGWTGILDQPDAATVHAETIKRWEKDGRAALKRALAPELQQPRAT